MLFTARYFPKTGAFKHIYAKARVYCNRRECAEKWIGKGGHQNGGGSGIRTLHHENMAGGHVTDLIKLRAYFIPNDDVVPDYARTTSAKCRTGSRRYCVYPKG